MTLLGRKSTQIPPRFRPDSDLDVETHSTTNKNCLKCLGNLAENFARVTQTCVNCALVEIAQKILQIQILIKLSLLFLLLHKNY